MKVLIINGPNLNMIGIREPNIYGHQTYQDLVNYLFACAKELSLDIEVYQSNHEGDIIDKIQAAYQKFDGIIINAGGYTHTSIAIMDALKAVSIPTMEVHLSDINKREEFRHISYIQKVALQTFAGFGFEGYKKAMMALKNKGKI